MFYVYSLLVLISLQVQITVQIGCTCDVTNLYNACLKQSGVYFNGHCFYLSTFGTSTINGSMEQCSYEAEQMNNSRMIGRIATFFTWDIYYYAVWINPKVVNNVTLRLGLHVEPGKHGNTRFDNYIWVGDVLSPQQERLTWQPSSGIVANPGNLSHCVYVNGSSKSNQWFFDACDAPSKLQMCELMCEGDVTPCGKCGGYYYAPAICQNSQKNSPFELCNDTTCFKKSGYELLANDLATGNRTSSESECNNTCSKQAGCVAYSYAVSTYSYSNNCLLKNSTGPVASNSNTNTGICSVDPPPFRYYTATDYLIWGSDLKSNYLPLSNCSSWCFHTAGCKAYTWNRFSNYCWLKMDSQPFYPGFGYSTGVVSHRDYIRPGNCSTIDGFLINGRCFMISTFQASWNNGLSWCRHYGTQLGTVGRLAHIYDSAIQSILQHLSVYSLTAWIGMKTINQQTASFADFSWIGSQCQIIAPVQPTINFNYSKTTKLNYPSCVNLNATGFLTNVGCANKKYFVCEFSCYGNASGESSTSSSLPPECSPLIPMPENMNSSIDTTTTEITEIATNVGTTLAKTTPLMCTIVNGSYGEWSEFYGCIAPCKISEKKYRKKQWISQKEGCTKPEISEALACSLDECNPLPLQLRLPTKVVNSLGCTFLIGSCAASILVAILLRDSSIEQLIHVAEDFTLMMAHIIIAVAGVKRNDEVFCPWVSLGIQYFTTSLFIFNTFEAVEVYCLITFVQSVNFFTIRHLVFIGFGIPLITVGITGLTSFSQLLSPYSCWLNLDDKTVTFLTLVPILINFCTSYVLLEAAGQFDNFDISLLKTEGFATAKINQRSMLILLPLQFAAWFFGQYAIFHQNFPAFSTVFALNVALGVTLFALHVLSNAKGHDLIFKLMSKIRKFG